MNSDSLSKRRCIVRTALSAALFMFTCSSALTAGQTGKGTDTDAFFLSNGLKVIFRQNQASEITVCQILIHGGKKAEPAGKEGLSYLTTRLCLEFPDLSTIQNIMSQATELNMGSRMDYSQISLACLSEHFEDSVKLISQILLHPLFSGIRIDRIKDMMSRTKEFQEDDSIAAAHQAVLDSFFLETPYSMSPYGTEASLKAIKKRDIDTFYSDFFRAPNMVFAVSSDLDQTKIHDILEKHYADLPSTPVEKHPADIKALIPEERILSIEKDTQQTLVLSAFPIFEISPRNYVMSHFLYYLIGHGVNSKLWPLRAKEKLAYNVNSSLALFREGGVLEAFLETESNKKENAIEAMHKILDDLHEKGISEEELKTTKSYYRGAFLRQIESKQNRTHALLHLEAVGLGYEFLDQIFQEIEATSLEEINSFIQTTLDPTKRVDVLVGPDVR